MVGFEMSQKKFTNELLPMLEILYPYDIIIELPINVKCRYFMLGIFRCINFTALRRNQQ